MKLLLLGLSGIARRRVLPAAFTCSFETIEVASRTAALNGWSSDQVARVYDDYAIALNESTADLVYVSTVNSLHAELAEKALHQGRHVIVDKPAFLSVETTERLINLARKKCCLLTEATVWPFHPAVQTARQIFAEADSEPTQIVSTFSFPPLPAHDFRYKRDLGGGALLDLGPYAITPGRVFFGESPSEILARTTGFHGEVESAFSLIGVFSRGRSIAGSFGFQTGYINRIEIAGPTLSVALDRVFSPPADHPLELIVRASTGTTCVSVPPADNFALMLSATCRQIASGSFEASAQSMSTDAQALAALREASVHSVSRVTRCSSQPASPVKIEWTTS